MPLHFTVFIHVSRPVHDVYEAVADPAQLSSYFTTGGAVGRIESGATVMWDFHDFPGAFPVEVVEAVPGERLAFDWGEDVPGEKWRTRVTMRFSAVDGDRTRVDIEEGGWDDSEAGRKASYGNCMGWSQMLCALKAWVEHGINLRDGAYR
jgi:uncharacterized protein YndB with AHSA1/START domain